MPEWTAQRIDVLKRLWAEGATAAAIAIQLGGMSRSAVLGKVFRLRLRPPESILGEDDASPIAVVAGAPILDTRATPPDTDAAPVLSDLLARRRRSKRNDPGRRPPPPAGQHKSLLELTNETCRWPHGRPGTNRFFFCGALEADLERGRPYCKRHMQRAYDPAESAEAVEGAAANAIASSLLGFKRPMPDALRPAGPNPRQP